MYIFFSFFSFFGEELNRKQHEYTRRDTKQQRSSCNIILHAVFGAPRNVITRVAQRDYEVSLIVDIIYREDIGVTVVAHGNVQS